METCGKASISTPHLLGSGPPTGCICQIFVSADCPVGLASGKSQWKTKALAEGESQFIFSVSLCLR